MTGTDMARRIVVKFGGALITDKNLQSTANVEIIRSLCSIVKRITNEGVQVIVVHGAGSFGHLKAKRWRLNEGHIPDFSVDDDSCTTQLEAVQDVRNDMLQLNSIVVQELHSLGLNVVSHPPHQWASELGPDFSGTLDRFDSKDSATVHVSFGDVVDVRDERQFGILSGDDLVARLALNCPMLNRWCLQWGVLMDFSKFHLIEQLLMTSLKNGHRILNTRDCIRPILT